MYDIAVIGAGPAGSQAAYRLAGLGYSVVVLERKERLEEPVCCTGIISQECVSSFGIESNVIFRPASGARFFSPSGDELRLWRREPMACMVDRPALNVALAMRARSKGAEYILDSLVRGLVWENDRIKIEVDHQGEESRFEARAVVIATGFGPKPVSGLTLGKVEDFVAGAQAEVETAMVEEIEVYLGRGTAPAFFGWLVPTLPGRALVGLLSRRRPGFYLKKLISRLSEQGKIITAEPELSYGVIPLKTLPRTYTDRLLVVGSAAGQVKPTTGGGVYYGLLCADIAADNLHRALADGDLSARRLAGYEKEWQKKLGPELKTGYRSRKIYELLSDKQIDRIFDIIVTYGIGEALMAADDLSFDWHGRTVLKLMGHQAISRVLKAMKRPFSL